MSAGVLHLSAFGGAADFGSVHHIFQGIFGLGVGPAQT
jgi:hypothetical protein